MGEQLLYMNNKKLKNSREFNEVIVAKKVHRLSAAEYNDMESVINIEPFIEKTKGLYPGCKKKYRFSMYIIVDRSMELQVSNPALLDTCYLPYAIVYIGIAIYRSNKARPTEYHFQKNGKELAYNPCNPNLYVVKLWDGFMFEEQVLDIECDVLKAAYRVVEKAQKSGVNVPSLRNIQHYNANKRSNKRQANNFIDPITNKFRMQWS